MDLTAEPRSLLSWSYDVFDGGRRIASVDRPFVRERADLSIGGEKYSVRREAPLRGLFKLERRGRVVATAEKPSVFQRRFVVRTDGRELELDAASPVSRSFHVNEGGQLIGSVQPARLFSRRALIYLPEELGDPVRVFLFVLVAMLWKRGSDAAAS